ncbi:MAG: Fructose-1-phosphate phosphatase YqaB [Verrucomicrobia bacterium ADurb.Bin474]|nr:MAG: Fructose-1-phosphate phosphatase YqaB [Verrucomicrobia bacterium ADurb.Bin474]
MKFIMIDLSPYHFNAFIFDCDGTIADTMPLHYKSWVWAFEQNGAAFPFTEDAFLSMAGIGLRDTVRMLNEKHADRLDIETVVSDKEHYYQEHLNTVEPVADTVAIIREYHGKIPMAVASGSYRETVMMTLRILGLERYFETVVCQDDVCRGKPAPDMFLLAACRLGQRASDCLVFEDGDLGIEAAVRAGMPWIRVISSMSPVSPISAN